MAQYKKISISSMSTVLYADNSFVVDVKHNYDLPDTSLSIENLTEELDTLRAEIPEIVKYQDAVKSMEGQLMIKVKDDVDFAIDIDGNLVVLHENAGKYFIDQMGNLIYSF